MTIQLWKMTIPQNIRAILEKYIELGQPSLLLSAHLGRVYLPLNLIPLDKGLANFSFKEADSKYFRLYGPVAITPLPL